MMKRFVFSILAAALALASGCASGSNSSAGETATPAIQSSAALPDGSMTVTSSGIADGFIDPAYGANGNVKENGIPVLSLPLIISGAPEGTVCCAVYMDDPDAKPLCGYNWVHWMMVNVTENDLPEDFSRTAQDKDVQGLNDNGTVGYAGPAPPDKNHTYVITVYALDAVLALSEGFSKEEFAQAIEGHVLASAPLEGTYKK